MSNVDPQMHNVQQVNEVSTRFPQVSTSSVEEADNSTQNEDGSPLAPPGSISSEHTGGVPESPMSPINIPMSPVGSPMLPGHPLSFGPAPHANALLPIIQHHKASIFSLQNELTMAARELAAAQQHIEFLQQREMAVMAHNPALHTTSTGDFNPVLLPPLQPHTQPASLTPLSTPSIDHFVPYLDRATLEEGVKDGSLVVGRLHIVRHSDPVAFVKSPALGTDIRLDGEHERNRALNGDIVVVRLLPQEQWLRRDADQGGARPLLMHHSTKLGEDLDESQRAAIFEAFGPSVDPLACLTPPQLDPNMLARGVVVAVLDAAKQGAFFCRLQQATTSAPTWCTQDVEDGVFLPGPLSKETRPAPVDKVCVVVGSNRGRLVRLVPIDATLPLVEVPLEALPPQVHPQTICIVQLENGAWDVTTPFPQGNVVKVMRATMAVELDMILHNQGIGSVMFPEEVAQAKLPKPKHEDWAGRVDLRNTDLAIALIDDDLGIEGIDGAVSCRGVVINGKQAYRVGVHVTDITHFVATGSELDVEAKERGMSVVLPSRSVTLFPPQVAESCALNDQGDRLTFSLLWTVTEDGAILNEWMGKTIVREWCVLPARDVSKVLKGQATADDATIQVDPAAKAQVFSSMAESIKQLFAVATAMRRVRLPKGALMLRRRNVGFKFTQHPVLGDVPVKVSPDTEQDTEGTFIVEEMAMFANHRVACRLQEYLPKHTVTFSNVPVPMLKTAALCKAAQPRGINVDGLSADALALLLTAVDGSKTQTAVGIQAAARHLLTKYQYSCKDGKSNRSEAGAVAHFTCPLRRHIDTVTHRLLAHVVALENQKGDVPNAADSMATALDADNRAAGYSVEDLQRLCESATKTAVQTTQAQRVAGEVCLALYLQALAEKKREPYITAVAYVVDLTPNTITLGIPAYGISAEVPFTSRHQHWAEVRYRKETHMVSIVWDSGEESTASLLTAFESRIYYCQGSVSGQPGVQIVLGDLLEDIQKTKRRQNPKTAADHILVGQHQELEHNYSEAAESYTAAIELNSQSAEAYVKRGDLLANHSDDTEGALEDYSAALRCDPRCTSAYIGRSRLLSKGGNYTDALEDCMQALRIAPMAEEVYTQRATVYKSLGHVGQAAADYGTVIQLNPRAVDAYYQRGCLHAAKYNDYTAVVAAVADFTAAIDLEPSHVDAHSKRGEVLYERFHDIPRAVRDFAQAAALRHKHVHPALFQSYQHMGFATEATYFEHFEQTHALHVQDSFRHRVREILCSVQDCQLYVHGPTATGLNGSDDTLDLCVVPGYGAYADWWKSQGAADKTYQVGYLRQVQDLLQTQLGCTMEAMLTGCRPLLRCTDVSDAVPVAFTVSLEYTAVRRSLLFRQYLGRGRWMQAVAFHLIQLAQMLQGPATNFLSHDTVLTLLVYFLVQQRDLAYIDPASVPATQTIPADALFDSCIQFEAEYEQFVLAGEEGFLLGKTICDFFHFYAFEFEYASRVVSLSVPGVRTKKAKGWADELCLEDPYAPEHNMAKGIPLVALRQWFAGSFDSVMEAYTVTCGLESFPEMFMPPPQEPSHEPEDTQGPEPETHEPERVPVAVGEGLDQAAVTPEPEPIAPPPPPPAPKKVIEPTTEEIEILDALVKAVPARCRVTLKALESTHWKPDRRKRLGPLLRFLARFPDALKVEGALVFRPSA